MSVGIGMFIVQTKNGGYHLFSADASHKTCGSVNEAKREAESIVHEMNLGEGKGKFEGAWALELVASPEAKES